MTQQTQEKIISPDTKRQNRIPPGQSETKKWPVLHHGSVPQVDLDKWTFKVDGLIEQPIELSYREFTSLPTIEVFADMHCVTKWSRLENTWEGVGIKTIIDRVRPKPEAKFVIVYAEQGWTTNVPVFDLTQNDVLFAWKNNGQEITPEHGWPLRLVVPRLYAWKSAKWITRMTFTDKDRPGFWESVGYHMHGDPWKEERFQNYC